MRTLGLITVFVLFVIAVFFWSASNVINQIRSTQNSAPQYGIGGGPGIDISVTANPESSDESFSLPSLFQEHAITGAFHLQDLYDGKDTAESAGRLQTNGIKIAGYFKRNLGIDENQFLEMWDGHIREYENYTNSLKNNDRAGTGKAREALNGHAIMMGTMINRARPDIPASGVERLMNEHIDLSLSVIEAHARGDTATKLEQATKASTQAVAFAEALVEAMAKEIDPSSSPSGH